MSVADARRAGFSLVAGVAVSLLGVAALARSYPWGSGYPLLAWVAAPLPILLYGILKPTVWLLNVLLWTAIAWLSSVSWRWMRTTFEMMRANWSSLRHRRARRALAVAALVGLTLALQYVAVSNTSFFPTYFDDTGSWRNRSLIPVHWRWWRRLEIVRPVLIQPLATPVRFAIDHYAYFRGTIVGRWLASGQGVVEDARGRPIAAPEGYVFAERKWDLQLTAANTAIWFLLAFGLLRTVRIRFPALSLIRYSAIVAAGLIALSLVQYGWHQRCRWSGMVAARWDAHFGTLAFCFDAPLTTDARAKARISYSDALKRNLCGVETRQQGSGPQGAEFARGYNSVMEREVRRRFGRTGYGECLDRVTLMMWKWYDREVAGERRKE